MSSQPFVGEEIDLFARNPDEVLVMICEGMDIPTLYDFTTLNRRYYDVCTDTLHKKIEAKNRVKQALLNRSLDPGQVLNLTNATVIVNPATKNVTIAGTRIIQKPTSGRSAFKSFPRYPQFMARNGDKYNEFLYYLS